MNKIFKVVWSKAKNCYVVVSEVAKNVITGSIESAKIGGTPMTRGLALGVMVAFIITGNAWAESVQTIDLPTGDEKSPIKATDFEKIGFIYSNGFVYKDYNFANLDEPGENIIVQTSGEFYWNSGILDFWVGRNDANDGILRNITLKINHDMYFGKYTELAAAHVVKKRNQSAYNNKIIIDGCNVKSGERLLLFAGFGNNSAEGSVVRNNSIIISNAFLGAELETTSDYNGMSIIGGNNNKWDSVENKVILDNVKFQCGRDGFVDNSDIEIKGGRGVNNANKNEVFIYNGSINDVKVYGGHAVNGNAKDNIVTMQNVTINNSCIYGGYSSEGGIVSGNTLNIGGEISGVVNEIGGFATINYDDLKWNTKVPVLKTANLVLDSNEKIAANVNGLANGSTPKKGEVMTLLDTNNKDLPDNYLFEFESTFNSGDFLQAEGKIYQDAEDIKLKITRVGTNDQALVIGESRVAATAFANQGSELIEIGLDTLARDKSDKETKVFASVYGNTSEYATGSHVKVNGWSGIVGVAKTNDDGLTTGAFFENGEGNYRTFNNFEGFLMRGDGEANYNGGGFFARKDNANGVYTEASLRAGNLQNELRKAVITDSKLEGYDIDTFYYGAHVGVGRIIPRGNEGDSIDVYGKFIYTHHDSEDFAVGGDDFYFDSIDSERLRFGFRINEVQNDKLSMYYGAAWEYEFNGDANNTVVGYDISTPSLGGSTGIGEIGAHYKANEKWNFDANLRGYAGQRDGFTGSVQANYLF